MSRFHIIHHVNKLLAKTGWQIKKQSQKYICNSKGKTLINIGSGDWECPGWINLDYPSEWYKRSQEKYTIVPYDIRNDTLPFENESADVAYCSHVIDHIEDNYIEMLFSETFRVLKKNGVIRICCPDADFLYEASRYASDYRDWRLDWFNASKQSDIEKYQPRPVDFLVREIATPKLLGYKHAIEQKDYLNEFEEMDKEAFFKFITNGLVFREKHVGNHINYWTFEKLKTFLNNAGFTLVIRSKYSGSIVNEMKNMDYFDLVYPNMSLYVEAVKQ